MKEKMVERRRWYLAGPRSKRSYQFNYRQKLNELETEIKNLKEREKDEFLGIYSRNGLEKTALKLIDYLKEEFGKTETSDLMLFVIDLDKFKSINDKLGHSTGDKVLQEVSRSWQKNLRAEDILGRWGGDEFVVLAFSREAEPIKNRLEGGFKTALENLKFTAGFQDKENLGFSLGWAKIGETTDGQKIDIQKTDSTTLFQTAFDLADTRMYESKRKNEISVG